MKKLIIVLVAGLAGFSQAETLSGNAEKTIMPVTVMFRIKTNDAVAALKDRDFFALARLVDPQMGLRFSPQAYIEADSVVIPKNQVADFFRDGAKRVWGAEDGSGEPISLTNAAYYERFIYDADFSAFNPVYNIRVGVSNTVSNIAAFYPKALFSEFHYPGSPALGSLDWKSLRLVFVEKDYDVYLAAIVHDGVSI